MKIDKSRIRGISKVEMNCYTLGPFLVHGNYAEGEFDVPLITAEAPLVLAVNRGRSVVYLAGGVGVEILKDEMTRAPLITTFSHDTALRLSGYIKRYFKELKKVAESTTRFGKLTSIDPKVCGSDLYLRIGMSCGDAAGHNITEKAAIAISKHLEDIPEFKGSVYLFSISSNYDTDKKPSRVNLVEGRGKWVKAKAKISREIVEKKFRTLPETIVELNYKKNVIGSILAGTLGGCNSHYANMVAAVFLATGQDVANVVEGSMGFTTAECTDSGDLLFGIEMPCLICGTIGGGIDVPYAQANLERMRCAGGGNPSGSNAKKFAEVIAAVVCAGELSTMAELTKGGEFIKAHLEMER